jgi:hypothetical protein
MWLLELPLLAVAVVSTGYLALVATAALLARPGRRGGRRARRTRFAVVVLSRREAAGLRDVLAALAALDYPRQRYEVLVLADDGDDATLAVARAHGARVLEPAEPARRGPGAALGWTFAQLVRERRHGAVVVVGPGSRPAPDLLTELDAALRAGARVVRACVGPADARWGTALPAAKRAVADYLRPLGRQALGASAGLRESGFCLTRRVLRRVPWTGASAAAHQTYHVQLLVHGLRAAFAPHAVVETAVEGLAVPPPEVGRVVRARRELWTLLRLALGPGRRPLARRWVYLDAALDLAVPPFALLVAGTAAMMSLHGLAWLAGGPPTRTFIWASLLLPQAYYVLAGCTLAGLRWRAYAALFVHGPLYVTARVWTSLADAWTRGREWVPAPRDAARQRAA